MKVLITGGAGFIGSHVAEYYAQHSEVITVFDNLSRSRMMRKDGKNSTYSWEYLKKYNNIELIKGDVRNSDEIEKVIRGVDVIIHTAAQTAVTTSLVDPGTDFTTNAVGTFNVLEAAREVKPSPVIIFCSTNKVYGENVNSIKVNEEKLRYVFRDGFQQGIPETFPIDSCEHTPYGCSKLAADLYAQEYARFYGLKTGVFRMSCIYGTRQFGVEGQGWLAHFVISTILGRPLTIYGDGKQVRDVLHVSDLIDAFNKFLNTNLNHGVLNIGRGFDNTLSLLELLNILEELTGKRGKITFSDWRPSDQKVYVSNISKGWEKLRWRPKVSPREGIRELIDWVEKNRDLFF